MNQERIEGTGSHETDGPIVHPELSPEDLVADNRSPAAKEEYLKWRAAYETGNAFLEIDCSDARSESDDGRVSKQSSVAVGFPFKRDYSGLYNDGRFRGIVIKTHYDGIESKPGERPVGCGGQDTAEAIRAGTIRPGKGITGFVNANVDWDPLVQGMRQAGTTIPNIERDGKILVVAYDHRRAETHPVGEYSITGGVYRRAIPKSLGEVVDARSRNERIRRYNPQSIYESGMPSIGEVDLSDESLEYLEIARNRQIELIDRYPDFEEIQKVQNPFAIVVRDSKFPLRIVYPTVFREPNSAFRVSIPRSKEGEVVLVGERAIRAAVDQVEYAVTHSIENHDNPNAPFSNSRLVLIETADMRQSIAAADALLSHSWMQEWHQMEGHKIFVSQSRAGLTSRIDELPKAA